MQHLPAELASYVPRLIEREERKLKATQKDPQQWLLAYSGMQLNWIGEWLSDSAVHWEKRRLAIDDLTLTGTNPEWNKVILERAERDPKKFRALLEDQKVRNLFAECAFDADPILIRIKPSDEGDKLYVLDGMHRTIAAICQGFTEVDAWIGRRQGQSQAQIEPHVIYDLLRAVDEGRAKQEDFVAAMRLLASTYGNVAELLDTRFGPQWMTNNDKRAFMTHVQAEAQRSRRPS